MDHARLKSLRQQDRDDLAGLLVELHGAGNALRRDECGDPVVAVPMIEGSWRWRLATIKAMAAGSRGEIRSCNGKAMVYVAGRSARHWTAIKQALASFTTIGQDGDDEGVLQLDRVPAGDEAAKLRAVIGLRQTRPAPACGFALAPRGFRRAGCARASTACRPEGWRQ